ncbi:MAG TPA: hypothetical protein VFM88_17875 [Vicinamibacteria bacterium]|nr:hypothetical protein [Vicinamibacteria bacterium]
MTTTAHPVPSRVDRLQRGATAAAVIGGVACLAGWFANAPQFYRSWLFAYLFWVNVGIGCLSLVMIHHLSGGMWGLVIRRMLEAGTRTMYLAPLFFVPVAVGMGQLFPWAAPEAANDHLLRHKAPYLNTGFFMARAAFYFAVWAFLAHQLSRLSAQLDAGPSLKASRRLRGVSGGGLLLMGLTITFASVDWAMSLDPHWFSTIYGVLFMVGQALAALTLVIVLLALFGKEAPFAGVVKPVDTHDLGKLMLAFTMLWAYIHLSQFLITWAGNLPEEIPWYIRRMHGGWQAVAQLLILFHFALPFLLLLSRDLKRNAKSLAVVAFLVFVVRLLDLFWLVAPDLQGHGAESHGIAVHGLDLAAPIALGGMWLAFFAHELRRRPLLPIGEPEIRERIEKAA